MVNSAVLTEVISRKLGVWRDGVILAKRKLQEGQLIPVPVKRFRSVFSRNVLRERITLLARVVKA